MLPLLLNSYILIIYSIYRRCQLHYDMLNLYSLGTIPDSITPSLFHRIIASKYAVRWLQQDHRPAENTVEEGLLDLEEEAGLDLLGL